MKKTCIANEKIEKNCNRNGTNKLAFPLLKIEKFAYPVQREKNCIPNGKTFFKNCIP